MISEKGRIFARVVQRCEIVCNMLTSRAVQIWDIVRPYVGGSVVHLGSGDGAVCILAALQSPYHRPVIGVEKSEEMVRLSRPVCARFGVAIHHYDVVNFKMRRVSTVLAFGIHSALIRQRGRKVAESCLRWMHHNSGQVLLADRLVAADSFRRWWRCDQLAAITGGRERWGVWRIR